MAELTEESLKLILIAALSKAEGGTSPRDISISAIRDAILIERERCFQACINFANSHSYDENYRSVIYDCADHIKSGI